MSAPRAFLPADLAPTVAGLAVAVLAVVSSAVTPPPAVAATPRDTSAWRNGPPAAPAAVLVRGATIWTGTERGVLADADLLVRGGKVVAVGPGLEVPADALVVEAAGKHLTPGLIDAHSHSAILGSVNESSRVSTAEVRVEDVIDADSIELYRQLAGGVTTINLLHGSANAIGGQSAVIKLRWGATPDALLFAGAPPGIKFALGENPRRANANDAEGDRRYPQTRQGVEQVIRQRFQAALDYREAWRAHELDPSAVAPRRDFELEALLEVLDGRRWVHAHSYRADEILMLLRVAEDFGFRVATFQHVLEGYKVADELAAHGAGASGFSDWWAYKFEVIQAIPWNGALLHERGVVVSFNSDSSELARRLNLEAAKAVRYGGVPAAEALGFVTRNPAIQLGIADRVGSLEPGKDADFVLWSGSPLSTFSICEQTWIDGRKYFDVDEDHEAREGLASERRDLIAEVRALRKGDAEDAVGAAPAAAAETNREVAAPTVAPRVETAPPAAGEATAFVGATIHPVSGPEIAGGVLVVAGGRIVAVGAEVEPPPGARIVDLAGRHLYPGFVAALTRLGLAEVGSVRATRDDEEVGELNSDLRAEVAVNADSLHLPVAMTGGVLTAQVAMTGGLFAGRSAVIALRGWNWEDMTIRADVGMDLVFPAISAGGKDEEAAKAGDQALASLDEILVRARRYRDLRAAGERVDVDAKLEALLPVLAGELPLWVHAQTKTQIEAALDWAAREGLGNLVLVAGPDVQYVAERLAKARVPVVLAGVLTLPSRRDEPYDMPFVAARKLHEAGVRFAIADEGEAANVRNLPFQAAMAAAFGLPADAALRSVTLTPAEILGVADRVGSLDVGKDASFIVTDGDPLEIVTKIEGVWLRGEEVDLMQDPQRRLYEKYRQRPGRASAARSV